MPQPSWDPACPTSIRPSDPRRSDPARLFPLNSEPVTIGRGPGTTSPSSDLRASRVHARIEPDADGYWLADAGSQNGTWRNGERCERARLAGRRRDPDRLDAARVPRGVRGRRDARRAPPDVLDDARPRRRSPTSRERFRRVATPPPRDEHERRARTEFFEQLIDAAVELTSAERGFLIMNAREGMQFLAARNIGQEDRKDPAFEVSWSIAVRVGTSGEGVLLVDAQSDDRFGAKESVESLGLRSILCLPIRSTAGVQGVIYLDNRLKSGAFSKEDRDVIEVLADQAGIVLEQERLATRPAAAPAGGRGPEQPAQDAGLRAGLGDQPHAPRAPHRLDRTARRGFGLLVGGSARMDELRGLLAKIAACDLPGARLRRIGHRQGARRARDPLRTARAPKAELVTVNCAAFPETLLENELFGHVRGAYTGADRSKKGLFEVAHEGTLFLDEVASMSQAMQIRLLRVLQDGEVRPVGAPSSVRVDVRVIAASNQDLRGMVAAGTFREDLYYRLRVLQVNVPPLRERREDIPALVAHFLEKHELRGRHDRARGARRPRRLLAGRATSASSRTRSGGPRSSAARPSPRRACRGTSSSRPSSWSARSRASTTSASS